MVTNTATSYLDLFYPWGATVNFANPLMTISSSPTGDRYIPKFDTYGGNIVSREGASLSGVRQQIMQFSAKYIMTSSRPIACGYHRGVMVKLKPR